MGKTYLTFRSIETRVKIDFNLSSELTKIYLWLLKNEEKRLKAGQYSINAGQMLDGKSVTNLG